MNGKDRFQEEHSAQVRELFSQIAPVYDFMNHLLSLGMDRSWRKRAARKIKQTRRINVLDICGGTGDFAWQLHSHLPEAQIIIADFAHPTLQRAQYKYFSRKQITFVECDALSLPFPDESFQVVACAFGIRNLADLEQGIEEFRRVLKPGGELLILEFMGKQQGFFYRIFSFYFRRILPFIGRLFSGHKTAYRYLFESVRRFTSEREFSKLLHRKGFQIKQVRRFSFGICTLYHARRNG